MRGLDGAVRELEDVYWSESLEEAIILVKEMMALGSPMARCGAESLVSRGLGDSGLDAALLMARALLAAQCLSAWRLLDEDSKARVLAPLYKAIYGLHLASVSEGGMRDAHYSHALEMLRVAIEEAGRLGLLRELKRAAAARRRAT
jgi:hypothetical protein